MCQPIKGTLSLDPNGAGVRPEFDWLQLNTWRSVAESPRFSRLKKLKLYNAIDPKADPWFVQFAEHLTRSQTGLDADFEYAVHTDRLSLTDWDPGSSRCPLHVQITNTLTSVFPSLGSERRSTCRGRSD